MTLLVLHRVEFHALAKDVPVIARRVQQNPPVASRQELQTTPSGHRDATVSDRRLR